MAKRAPRREAHAMDIEQIEVIVISDISRCQGGQRRRRRALADVRGRRRWERLGRCGWPRRVERTAPERRDGLRQLIAAVEPEAIAKPDRDGDIPAASATPA
eukprot:4070281-Prymnesium_polylepis.3